MLIKFKFLWNSVEHSLKRKNHKIQVWYLQNEIAGKSRESEWPKVIFKDFWNLKGAVCHSKAISLIPRLAKMRAKSLKFWKNWNPRESLVKIFDESLTIFRGIQKLSFIRCMLVEHNFNANLTQSNSDIIASATNICFLCSLP